MLISRRRAAPGLVLAIIALGAFADASATTVTVDFHRNSAQYPPTVNKIGFNSFWDSTCNHMDYDVWTLDRSAAWRAPMIGALVEPKSLVSYPAFSGYTDAYEEVDGDWSAEKLDGTGCPALWKTGSNGVRKFLFMKSGGIVVARTPTDSDLLGLRDAARDRGLTIFLQLSGTPGTAYPHTAGSLNNGLFDLVGEPKYDPKEGKYTGNWYPLPALADLPTLAGAFGTFPDAFGYETPMIYAFWQEPSHTIDDGMDNVQQIARYSRLYWQVANKLYTACRKHCPVAGAQLNASNGSSTNLDGDLYKTFIDELGLRRTNNSAFIPLDYFTIQNYAAQWNDQIVANARKALEDAAATNGYDFFWTPVLMNEWDYCVNTKDGDGCGEDFKGFDARYNGDQSIMALHYLWDSVKRPDVSHVLLREKVLREVQGDGTTSIYPWTQVPILFMASMSEFRRPADTGLANLPIIASGDDDQIAILMWNEGSQAKTVDLALRNIPSTFNNKPLHVKRFSKAIRDMHCPGTQDVMTPSHAIDCWEDAILPEETIADTSHDTASITVEPNEAIMIFAGAHPDYTSTPFGGHLVRTYQLVERSGTNAPAGMAHIDPRTNSVTVAVKDGGHAVGKVVLEGVTGDLHLKTRKAQEGLMSDNTIAGIRVDYLDASGNPLKSVFFRDDRWQTATEDWPGDFHWPVTNKHSSTYVDMCGGPCNNGGGAEITLRITDYEPKNWSGNLALGVVLAGTGTDAIYRVELVY